MNEISRSFTVLLEKRLIETSARPPSTNLIQIVLGPRQVEGFKKAFVKSPAIVLGLDLGERFLLSKDPKDSILNP